MISSYNIEKESSFVIGQKFRNLETIIASGYYPDGMGIGVGQINVPAACNLNGDIVCTIQSVSK